MKLFKLLLVILLIMPFFFIAGTVASCAKTIGPISIGNYYIQFNDIAVFGESLRSATQDIVQFEIDAARNIIQYIKDARPLDMLQIACAMRRLALKSV